MQHFLPLLLLLFSSALALTQNSFHYTARVENVRMESRSLYLDVNLRVDGEVYSPVTLTVSSNTPLFKEIMKDQHDFHTSQLYYDVRLKCEIPKTKVITNGRFMTRPDAPDAQAFLDLNNQFSLQPKDMISFKRITQNEFLNISSKIVTP